MCAKLASIATLITSSHTSHARCHVFLRGAAGVSTSSAIRLAIRLSPQSVWPCTYRNATVVLSFTLLLWNGQIYTHLICTSRHLPTFLTPSWNGPQKQVSKCNNDALIYADALKCSDLCPPNPLIMTFAYFLNAKIDWGKRRCLCIDVSATCLSIQHCCV